MSDVTQLISKLKQESEERFPISLNSSKKKASASAITFNQQKDILGSITEGSSAGVVLQKILIDIILNNTTSEDPIYVKDKLLVILQLRKESISDVVTLAGEDIKLDDVISSVSKIKYVPKKDVKYKNIVVKLKDPTLKEELEYVRDAMVVLKNRDGKQLGDSVGDLYTYEIAKFVETVSIGEDSLTFSDLGIKDRLKVINTLPVKLNQKISEVIQKDKEQELLALTFDIKDKKEVLEIDVPFFDS